MYSRIGTTFLNTAEILYCKADDNYTEIYTEQTKIVASKTLKHFEESLKGSGFVRLHKSYLVNVNANGDIDLFMCICTHSIYDTVCAPYFYSPNTGLHGGYYR